MTPDSKDWTWVLDRPCPECGLDSAAHDPAATGSVLRECAQRRQAVLARPDVGVAAATGPLAVRFDGLSGGQWQRTGRRSDGASFTVTSFAQYFLHDVLHHLHDVKG